MSKYKKKHVRRTTTVKKFLTQFCVFHFIFSRRRSRSTFFFPFLLHLLPFCTVRHLVCGFSWIRKIHTYFISLYTNKTIIIRFTSFYVFTRRAEQTSAVDAHRLFIIISFLGVFSFCSFFRQTISIKHVICLHNVCVCV